MPFISRFDVLFFALMSFFSIFLSFFPYFDVFFFWLWFNLQSVSVWVDSGDLFCCFSWNRILVVCSKRRKTFQPVADVRPYQTWLKPHISMLPGAFADPLCFASPLSQEVTIPVALIATDFLSFFHPSLAGVKGGLAIGRASLLSRRKSRVWSRWHGEAEQQAAARDAAGPAGEHRVFWPWAAGVVQGTKTSFTAGVRAPQAGRLFTRCVGWQSQKL